MFKKINRCKHDEFSIAIQCLQIRPFFKWVMNQRKPHWFEVSVSNEARKTMWRTIFIHTIVLRNNNLQSRWRTDGCLFQKKRFRTIFCKLVCYSTAHNTGANDNNIVVQRFVCDFKSVCFNKQYRKHMKTKRKRKPKEYLISLKYFILSG